MSKNKDKINELFIEGNEIKLLEFEVKDKNGKNYSLALNIQKIKEVVEFQELEVIPDVFEPFTGLYNLRGTPIPVLNLLKFFTNTGNITEANINDRIIICDFQHLLIGIIVSKTRTVNTYNNSEVQPQPEALGQTQKHFFNGIIQKNNHIINLLDIEFILSSLKIDLGSKSVLDDSNIYENKRVLILEDSRYFQKKTETLFKKMGFDVVMAADGQIGMEMLKKHDFKFDLIFADIEMPVLNGIGFARRVKKMDQAKHIPIVFNTSLSNPTLKDDIEKEQLGICIVKFDEDSIFANVKLAFAA
ncbi:MAG: chemotaxis protein CheW [Oligoflexia bacterium]|nr:chemotaxis protein CheW [Oligoflexia bacterium]MBF0364163.1 chemotaxis protein CheW [Oligoflexia bacterium]